MYRIVKASFIYRFVAAVCAWFGTQWRESRLITAFLAPGKGQAVSESSVFLKLWRFLHRLFCNIFDKLRLSKFLEGSMFKHLYFWFVLAAALAPVVPTMALAGLAAVAFFSFFVTFSCDRKRELSYAPVNRYILLFAFIYFIATFTSVTVSGSLLGLSLIHI